VVAMTIGSVGFALDNTRAFTASRPINALHDLIVDIEHVLAIGNQTRNPIAICSPRKVLKRIL
jgi:hypothetical protein